MSEIEDSKRFHTDRVISIQEKNQTELERKKEPTLMAEHPLYNNVVLNLVFEHLGKKDWKSARLVNKTWMSTLQHRWRDQMVYKLVLRCEMGQLYLTDAQKTLPKRMKLMEELHPTNNPNDPMQLGRFPIRNISTRLDEYAYFILLRPNQSRFWELHGHGLKSICFHRIRIYRGALLKKLLFELTPNLEEFRFTKCDFGDTREPGLNADPVYTPPHKLQKNLKYVNFNFAKSWKINLDAVAFTTFIYIPQFPIRWIEFFSVFPNIQTLKVKIRPPDRVTDTPSDFLKIFRAIDIIRKANNNEVLNISQLLTDGFYNVDVIEHRSVFASLPIPILHLDVHRMSNDKIIQVVQTFSSSLCDLTLTSSGHFIERYELPKDILPLPLGLKKLTFSELVISSLEFLASTPNLEDLTMRHISLMLNPAACVPLAALRPLVNLKRLQFTLVDWAAVENMHIFATLMPNVKTFVCTVGMRGFLELCRLWPNIEHLDVWFDQYGLTEDFFVEHLIQLKRLKSLKVFSFWFEISDKSVFEGFLKLPSLNKIHLASVRSEISDRGLKALEGKLFDNFEI